MTELITGVDLVKEQIRIAEGKKLSFNQDDLTISGHSLEVRVYAEDPKNNFLPCTGSLTRYVRPQGAGVRVDDGYEEGMDVSVFYDPMIAKLITHGKDRTEAVERMKRAIHEYQIAGVETTLPFCDYVLNHKDFINGTFTTKFVEKYFTPEVLDKNIGEEHAEVAAIIAYELFSKKGTSKPNSPSSDGNKWKRRLSY